MRQIFTLLAGATIILSSCSSTHKAAQTPDDVYYSPASPRNTVAARTANGDQDEYYSTAPSDNYVRMKSVDENRWSYFDDYSNYDAYYSPMSIGMGYGYYGYSGYGFGFDPYFGWNNYFMWNTCYNPYFYNPYYGAGVVLVNPKFSGTPVYTHLRTFNPSSYNSNSFVNGNNSNRFYRPSRTTTGSQNNNFGNNRFNNSNNTYRPANTNTGGGSTRSFSSQPTRTFSAPSGGGGGGGGGGGFRPGRH